MVNYDTVEDLEQFIDELEFLRKYTELSPLINSKISHLRNNNRNQRVIDQVEYKYRFKLWEKLLAKMFKDDVFEGKEQMSLSEFAHEILKKKVTAEKEPVMSR